MISELTPKGKKGKVSFPHSKNQVLDIRISLTLCTKFQEEKIVKTIRKCLYTFFHQSSVEYVLVNTQYQIIALLKERLHDTTSCLITRLFLTEKVSNL